MHSELKDPEKSKKIFEEVAVLMACLLCPKGKAPATGH